MTYVIYNDFMGVLAKTKNSNVIAYYNHEVKENYDLLEFFESRTDAEQRLERVREIAHEQGHDNVIDITDQSVVIEFAQLPFSDHIEQ